MKKILILFLAMILLTCCKTVTKTVEVPVETIKTEYVTNYKRDSLYVHDSIFINSKNDTVYVNKYRDLYHYSCVHDTLVRIDSIPKIIKTTETVEVNKLKGWQETLMYVGGGVLLLLLAFIGFKLFKLFK